MGRSQRTFAVIAGIGIAAAAGVAPEQQQASKIEPIAWLAVHSYERLEQRVREIGKLSKVPGLDEMCLGLIKMAAGGLQGLDAKRPIVAAFGERTLSGSGTPAFVVALPYSDRAGIAQLLQNVFPGFEEKDDMLELKRSNLTAFGRIDADAAAAILSTDRELLLGLDPKPPAGLFGFASDPDIVLRLNVAKIKESRAAFFAELPRRAVERIERELDRGKATRKQEKESIRDARKELRETVSMLVERATADWSGAEARLTLAPTGWVGECTVSFRPGSRTASFLADQRRYTSRLSGIASDRSLFHMRAGVRMTAELRRAIRPLFDLLRARDLDEIAPRPAASAEVRAHVEAVYEKAMALFSLLIEEKEVEVLLDAEGPKAPPAIGVVIPFPGGEDAWRAFLVALAAEPGEGPSPLPAVRKHLEHEGTTVHLFRGRRKGESSPGEDGLAAFGHGCWFWWMNAPAADRMTACLDRARSLPSAPASAPGSLVAATMFLNRMVEAGLIDASGDRAEVARVLGAPDVRLEVELLAGDGEIAARGALSESLIRAFAEFIGAKAKEGMGRGAQRSPKPARARGAF